MTLTTRRWKTYGEYRNSHIEGIGQIPSHWNLKTLRYLVDLRVSNVDKKSDENELPVSLCNYTDVYYHRYITQEMQFMDATASAEEIEKFQLRSGDVLITKDSESWSDIAVPAYVKDDLTNVICGYHLALLRPTHKILGSYLFWAFASKAVSHQLNIAATGITRFGLSQQDIKEIIFPIPPIQEQHLITEFLARETAKIDILITKKQYLLELIVEKRQAEIAYAITAGLDPSVSMKDSNIEWIGKIPREWETIPLKHYLYFIEQGWSPQCENRPATKEEWGVLKVGCVNYSSFDEQENKALEKEIEPLLEYEIQPNDLLVSRANTRELLGSAAIAPSNIRSKLLLCDKLYRLYLKSDRVIPEFVALAMTSPAIRYQIESSATGASSSMQNISQDTIANLLIPMPPISEQQEILKALDRKTARLNQLSMKVQAAIDLLQERRAALISAAVTGQINVMESRKDAVSANK